MSNEYLTKNKEKGAETKNWVLRLKETKPIKQASVKIRTKTYEYASKYEVQVGDIAIIGLQNQPKTQGEMGIVENTYNKLTINKDYAADLAFVFTDNPDKKMITACKKYLENKYDVDIVGGSNIFPVTYKVRRLIAAACIVAYPKLSTAEDIEMAKALIAKPQRMTDIPMADWYSIELYDGYANDSPAVGNGWLDAAAYSDMESSEEEKLEDEFNRRVFCDTIGIMLRGGFVNLLEAFLSANPPIDDFFDEVVSAVGKAYNDTAMDTLKAFNLSK